MANKIRIMFYTPSLNIGGIERVFVTYANALSHMYDVYFVFGHAGGDLKRLLDINVTIYSLGNIRLRRSLFQLKEAIDKFQPTYLVSGGEIPNVLCYFASRFSKTRPKNLFSHHNYFNVEHNKFGSELLIKLFYNRAYKVFSVSSGISSFLLEMGVSKNKLITLYNPINIKDIANKATDDLDIELHEYVVYVGRLNKVKNLFFLIESFRLFLKKFPSYSLVLVGDGDLKNSLLQYIRENELDHKILLIGSVSNPYPYISNAKLLLLPSLSEALPTVILEAFSLGVTVVATPTPGARDLLKNGDLGYISSSFTNPLYYADLMIQAIEHPVLPSLLKSEVMTYTVEEKLKELKSLIC